MNLIDFDREEYIFVDANIFVYHIDKFSKYSDSCNEFLSKIEHQRIKTVTSSLVIDEVIYALILLKASESLPEKRLSLLKKHLETDDALMKSCYAFVQQILNYLEILRLSGLLIQVVNFEMIRDACSLGSQYGPYPRDALHLATCQTFGIHHIATSDHHFSKIPLLTIWPP